MIKKFKDSRREKRKISRHRPKNNYNRNRIKGRLNNRVRTGKTALFNGLYGHYRLEKIPI